MSNHYNMSDEEFRDFQERFRNADPADKQMLVGELIDSLYTDIHAFFKRQLHPGSLQTTDMVLSFSGRKLNQFRKQFHIFQKAEKLDQYMHYLWRGIKWFVRDKIRMEGNSVISLSSLKGAGNDDEDNKQYDVPENQENSDVKEVAQQMMAILGKLLDDDEKELLMLVYDGIRFDSVQEKRKPDFNPEDRKRMQMTYAEIAEYLGNGQTADSVRMRHNRLIKKLQETPALIILLPEGD